MKTTYEKDSFYYAGEGTKTGAPGYEYSNLMFRLVHIVTTPVMTTALGKRALKSRNLTMG